MSEKPILYYIPGSPPVRTVVLIAKAIGLELELKYLNLAKLEHRQPEYLKLNPQHTVPTLVDDGKSIWDSHAISTYLIEKYGKTDEHQSLYPKDLYTRARIDQRLQFNTAHVFSVVRDLFYHFLYEKGYEVKPAVISNAQITFEFLETFLSESTFVVGDAVTVADYAILTSLTQVDRFISIDRIKFPKIIDWIKRMNSLANVTEINTVWLNELMEYMQVLLAQNKADAEGKEYKQVV